MDLKKAWITLCCTQFLWLSGCQNDNDPLLPPRVDQYISEHSYQFTQLDQAKSINVMTYTMQNVQGKLVYATALIYFPKTKPPKDGWRVVVWEHGPVGAGSQCAPSNQVLNDNFVDLAKKLLAKGYVILAPDYEGLGSKGIHPYLNLSSATKSTISAVEAFKEQYATQLNGAWMSVGQSQGGQAALGTAEYANQDPSFKGVVAAAPMSSFGRIVLELAPKLLAEMQDDEISKQISLEKRNSIQSQATLLAYAALVGIGIKAYMPDFNYQNLFYPRAAAFASLAEDRIGENGYCLQDDYPELSMVQIYQQDIIRFLKDNPNKHLKDYPGINAQSFRDNQSMQKFLKRSQLATKRIDKPVLVIQGMQDSIVPYRVTQELVENIRALSSGEVKLILVPKANHNSAMMIKQYDLLEFIEKHMPAK